jgi:hypothetical protein
VLCDLFGDPFGVGVPLSHGEQKMLTLATRFKAEMLANNKVLRLHTDPSGCERTTVRVRKTSNPVAHASRLFDQRNGMTGQPFAASDIAEALAGGRLNVDAFNIDRQIGGDVRAHRCAMLTEPRSIRENGGIDVYDCVAALMQQLCDLSYKHATIRSAPLGISVWKMHPDIAKRGGAQQCIA